MYFQTLKADLAMTLIWVDPRIHMNNANDTSFRQTLSPGQSDLLWVPDISIRHIKEMITDRGLTDTRYLVLASGQKVKYYIR